MPKFEYVDRCLSSFSAIANDGGANGEDYVGNTNIHKPHTDRFCMHQVTDLVIISSSGRFQFQLSTISSTKLGTTKRLSPEFVPSIKEAPPQGRLPGEESLQVDPVAHSGQSIRRCVVQ